ncbi:MAG TPA: carboxypeptidase-like regulatory domain-containing protein [Terriglobales bacterium]|nr:carboxypeptidase-like regulatory domain-containing protein [Terriglobales bacterium]
MKRVLVMTAVIFVALANASVAQPVSLGMEAVADKNDQGRNVTGQVFTKADTPISEAIVYLKNTKTLTIKSFITEKDGGYRFHGLSPNVDYEIYADYQGQKSPTKTISSFDSRSNITLNIHIDAK